MIPTLKKKILHLLLATVVSVVSFGAFAGIAQADIAADLISAGLFVDPASMPSGLREIPPDIMPDQQQVILTNIVNDTAVQGFLSTVNSAQRQVESLRAACSLDIACAGMASSTTSAAGNNATYDQLQAAITALNDANINFRNAVVAARDRQDAVIKQYQTDNLVNGNVDSTVGAVTSTAEKAQSDLSTQGQTDALNASEQAAVSQSQIDAAKQARDNAANFLNSSGDQVELTMQNACSLGILPGTSMDIMPCIAGYVFYPLYKITAYALMGSGFLFDNLLMLSIDNSNNMVTPGFINTTWTVVRDFSNMLFIFILIYTGVMTILGQANWRQTVLKVIFIALIINFSLFFTKVVIDAGNILAVGVRDAISTDSLSAGLAASFQPQKFLAISASTNDTSGGSAIIVFVVAAVVTGFAAYVFFKAAILFSKRLIVFWALMILSPFAFVSIAFPKGSKFQEWLHELVSQVFVAPVFLFFIYIIVTVIQADGGILSKMGTVGGGWFESLLAPVMVAMLLIKALQEALKYTEKMSGTTGEAFSNLVGGAMGLAGTAAIGAATGGVGLLGRATLGRAAQGLTDSGRLARVATGKSVLGDNAFARFAGRQAIAISDKARTGTWDVSGTGVGKSTLGKVASSVGAKMTGPGAGAKGGFEGATKRQDEADKNLAERVKLTDTEKHEIEEGAKGKAATIQSDVEEKRALAKKASDEAAQTRASNEFALKTTGKIDEIKRKLQEEQEKAEAEAKATLAEAEKELAKTSDMKKYAKSLAEAAEQERKDSVANYVEGRSTLAKFGVYGVTYSNAKAEKTAKKLRERKTEEQKEKDETKKIMKALAKLSEDNKKSEEGEAVH